MRVLLPEKKGPGLHGLERRGWALGVRRAARDHGFDIACHGADISCQSCKEFAFLRSVASLLISSENDPEGVAFEYEVLE